MPPFAFLYPWIIMLACLCWQPFILYVPFQGLCSTYQASIFGEVWSLHIHCGTPGQPAENPPLPGERAWWAPLINWCTEYYQLTLTCRWPVLPPCQRLRLQSWNWLLAMATCHCAPRANIFNMVSFRGCVAAHCHSSRQSVYRGEAYLVTSLVGERKGGLRA